MIHFALEMTTSQTFLMDLQLLEILNLELEVLDSEYVWLPALLVDNIVKSMKTNRNALFGQKNRGLR